MSYKYIPNAISKIMAMEEETPVVSIFAYKQTTAWIAIKEMLSNHTFDKNIRLETNTQSDISSVQGVRTLLKSFGYYLHHLFLNKKKTLFLGASTGIFNHNDKTLDAYFPYYDTLPTEIIYMLNCGNLKALRLHKDYVDEHHIVIENYLIVPFKKLLGNLYLLTLGQAKRLEIKAFNAELKQHGIDIDDQALFSSYSEFCAGYEIYRLFFKFLSIETAYVVSAPTKSDMVAALKSLDIKVIEIQHGVVGKLHRGYNYSLKPTVQLPTPDRINVYNQFWKEEILNAGYFTASQINIVGRLKYDIVDANLDDMAFKYIIFTGQGAFFEQITAFFIASESFLLEHNIVMFYKPHPRETVEEVAYFSDAIKGLKACTVYNGTHTTEELVKHSFAHVSIFSSCHFDAVYYKDKTFVFDVMDDNIMDYYAHSQPNVFIKVSTIKEVINNATNN